MKIEGPGWPLRLAGAQETGEDAFLFPRHTWPPSIACEKRGLSEEQETCRPT